MSVGEVQRTILNLRSVTLYGAFPRTEQLGIIVLLGTDTPLVLNLSKLGSTLFIHAILEVTAHRAVTLADLAEHISLMRLALIGVLECALLMHTVEAVDLVVNLLLVVLLKPLSLLLHSLLEQDVLLAILVYVLHQVDASLVLTAPLGFPSVPLLLVLNSRQVIDQLLLLGLVRLNILVVGLKDTDLLAAGSPLVCLHLFNSGLSLERSIEKSLIAVTISLLRLLAKLLLSSVVSDQLQVALAIQNETLLSILLLLLLFDGPLFAKHSLLLFDELSLGATLNITSVLLPVEHGHRVLDLFLLLTGLSHLTLELFLSIELPELSVDLLLHHFLLDVPSLVNKLLFTLDGSTIVVELLILTPEGVILSLKLHVLTAGDLINALLLTLALQGLEPLEHLLTNLLGRFKVVVKFLLVDSIFSSKKLGQLCFPLFKVGGLTATHVLNSIANDIFLDHLVSLDLPICLVCQVVVTANIIHLL